MFFYFAVLKALVASKNLDQSAYANKLLKKKKQNSASVKVLLQGYLIMTKQRFALVSADAIEISYIP